MARDDLPILRGAISDGIVKIRSSDRPQTQGKPLLSSRPEKSVIRSFRDWPWSIVNP
jgi:hypothetical protein